MGKSNNNNNCRGQKPTRGNNNDQIIPSHHLYNNEKTNSSSEFPNNNDDDDNDNNNQFWNDNNNNNKTSIPNIIMPSFVSTCIKYSLYTTLVLYVLNQQTHILPKPVSAIVSKVLFWPTMPITLGRRINNWYTIIDDTVIIGGAPFANIPKKLYEQFGVRSVINMCAEYKGPIKQYKQLGIKQLHLPTIDHYEPSLNDIETAIQFIENEKDKSNNNKVYIHCRAGHGRSAAIVFAWLLYKNKDANLKELNQEFCKLRYVKNTLWKQKNIIRFHSRLNNNNNDQDNDGQEDDDDSDDEYFDANTTLNEQ